MKYFQLLLMNLSTPQVKENIESLAEHQNENIIRLHGAAMLLIWSILVPIIILLTKQKKGRSLLVVWMHIITVHLFTLITIATVINLHGEAIIYENNGLSQEYSVHKKLGMIGIFLGVFQLFLGWTYKTLLAKNFVTKRRLKLSRKLHKLVGYAILVLGLLQNICGGNLLLEKQRKYIAAGLAIIFVSTFLVLRTNFLFKKKEEWEIIREKLNSKIKTISIQEYQQMLQDYPQKCLLLLDGLVLDVTNYIVHPGGDFILKQQRGREIGGYLSGSEIEFSELGFSRKNHNARAYEVACSFAIAKIEDTIQSEQFQKEQNNMSIHSQLLLKSDFSPKKWIIISKQNLSESLIKLSIQNECYDNNFKNKESTWLMEVGNHIKFTFNEKAAKTKKKLSRYYTVVKGLSYNNLQYISQLYQIDINQISDSHLINQSRNILDLYIKVYEHGKISQFINKLPLNQEIDGIGPISHGLCLTDKFLQQSPHLLVFCAGTAINVFSDLIFWVIVQNKISLPYKIKVTMFAACKSEAELIGYNLLLFAKENCSQDFQLYTYFSQVQYKAEAPNNQRFELQYLKDKLTQQYDRIYLVGPEHFEQQIAQVLEKLGKSKSLMLI